MKSIDGNFFGDILLVSVFAQFPNHYFKTDEAGIIKAFYNANLTGEFNALYKNYAFEDNGVDIYSKVLEQAINSMQITDLLRRDSHSKTYLIEKATKIRYDKFIKKDLTKKEKGLVLGLSDKINKALRFKK